MRKIHISLGIYGSMSFNRSTSHKGAIFFLFYMRSSGKAAGEVVCKINTHGSIGKGPHPKYK